MPLRRVCVFAGAHIGTETVYSEAAARLGGLLAGSGIGLVYGGGAVGLMGVLADAALSAGGEAIGVIPEALMGREVAHSSLSALEVVGSMHERKARMGELADAFVALPGGCGTMDELMEVVTWTQLGIHDKPCGLLNVAGYWDPLVQQLERARSQSFLRPAEKELLLVDDRAESLLSRLERWRDRVQALEGDSR